jgi:hypothetical protein
MEFSQWEEATRPSHLTIERILQMQPGESITLYTLDRNVLDHVKTRGVAQRPRQFLAHGSRLTWTKINDLTGTAMWWWEGITAQDQLERNFEFHVEFAPNFWYPLTNGRIPAYEQTDLVVFQRDNLRQFCDKSWNQFPVSTRIGWRGPALVESDLDDLPDVMYGPAVR